MLHESNKHDGGTSVYAFPYPISFPFLSFLPPNANSK